MIYKLPYQAETAIKAIQTAKEGFECIVRKTKKKRSLNQNAYYHGVVVKIFAQESGYTANEMHQVLTSEFLRYERLDRTFVKSTTELTTIEFEQYMENCRRLASEQGIYIPLPHELTEQMLHQLEVYG